MGPKALTCHLILSRNGQKSCYDYTKCIVLIVKNTLYIPHIAGLMQKDITPGGRLNKKDGLTRYGDSHVKDKTS